MTYIVLFAGIANIFLGIVALRYGKISKSIYSFAAFCFLTGLWALSNYLEYFYGFHLLVRVTFAFSSVVTTCLFAWAYFYASDKKVIRGKVLFPYLIYVGGTALFSVIAFTSLVVADVNSISYSGEYIARGPLFSLWAAITLFFYLASIVLIVVKYFSEEKEDRKKDLQMIWGLLVFGLFNMLVGVIFPLFGIMSLTKLSSPSSLIFVAFAFITIIKNQFLDIKLLLTQFLAIIIIATSLMDVSFSQSGSEFLLRFFFFVFVSISSILLVKSVELEIMRKMELEIANQQLRKLDEAKSEFISIASHQLRTPLTSSNGFLSMVFEGFYGEIPENLKEPLNHVNRANQRLLGLVEDLLNVSRIESGRMIFEFKPEKIDDLLKEIMDSFGMIAKQKNLGLVLKLPRKKLPTVNIDRVKVREAISNIIDNAIKYSKVGTVTVNAAVEKSFVKIIVQDTGIGIAKEDLPNVFEKFSRGTNQNRLTSTGSGLGLYFGKKVIEANYGKIAVESDGPGKGSRFVVEIPVA